MYRELGGQKMAGDPSSGSEELKSFRILQAPSPWVKVVRQVPESLLLPGNPNQSWAWNSLCL